MANSKTSSMLPQVLLIAAVVIVGWVSLVLLPSDPQNDQASVSTQQVEETTTNGDEFEFYGLLQAGEVEVTVSNYTSTPKTTALEKLTILQIAAFKDSVQAERVKAKLVKVGLETAQVVTRTNSTGTWHLVRTQPYDRYDQLKKALSLAEKLNYHPRAIQVQ